MGFNASTLTSKYVKYFLINASWFYSSNSSLRIRTTSLIVSSSKSVRFTKSAISCSNTLFAVSKPAFASSSITQASISSENSDNSTSSSAPSLNTSISYPVNCPAKRMLCPPRPIALLTSSGFKITSARLVSSFNFTEVTRAGLNALVTNSCALFVKFITSIFSFPNSRTIP